MLNYIKRGFGLLIAAVMMLNLLQVRVYAEETESAEAKVYSEATLQDEFADNRVLVVLNNEASLAVDQYETATSFAGISCSGIQNLNEAKEAEIQGKISSISVELEQVAMLTNTMEAVTQENVMKIAAEDEELSSYHQVLCLELEESGKGKVLETIAELEKQENVLYAGPDYVISLCAVTPNDTYFSEQWAASKIQLTRAWNVSTGSSSVKVAVLDTGIKGNHSEFSGKIDTGLCRDFTSGSTIPVGTPSDDHGHGTFVAGIIGATANNEAGVAGACWNVTLVSLKAFNSAGRGYSSHVGAAINFAESQSIPIINLSARWYEGNERYDYALYTVISNYSGLFVCAAGNESRDNDSYVLYPGNYDLDNIIVVGASDENDEMSSFSNYGATNVDIFAPGSNIYSTTYDGGYGTNSGTSFAAPYVAGAAALLLSKYPNLSTAELKRTIMQNVDIVYDANGEDVFGELCVSGGRLNVYRALLTVIHSYGCINKGVLLGHEYVCSDCGYSYSEGHTWVEMLSGYRCNKCLAKSSYLPVTPENLSDEEMEHCCE